MTCERTSPNRCERPRRIDKLGVTGSSPVPTIRAHKCRLLLTTRFDRRSAAKDLTCLRVVGLARRQARRALSPVAAVAWRRRGGGSTGYEPLRDAEPWRVRAAGGRHADPAVVGQSVTVDLLGFADIAAPALEALGRDRLDPVAVGIVGWWGSGKSTILGLIEQDLRAKEDVLVVSTRTWEHDPATAPKATLIGEALTVLHQSAERSKTLGDEIEERFKRLAARWHSHSRTTIGS
jgi:hypothetical protein